ncbi:hypothetical protein EDB80DRAFT_707184, partial [Ilyonectria destructans]
ENWVDSNWASTRKIRMERLPHREEVGEPTIACSKRLVFFFFFFFGHEAAVIMSRASLRASVHHELGGRFFLLLFLGFSLTVIRFPH